MRINLSTRVSLIALFVVAAFGALGLLEHAAAEQKDREMESQNGGVGGSPPHLASTSKTIEAALFQVLFKKPAGPKYGFDDFTNNKEPWKSVKVGDSDTATSEINPSAHANVIYFKSVAAGKVTVAPAQAGASPQTLTFTGVAKGESEIQGNGGSDTGPTIGKMNAVAYNMKTRTCAVILVHEENDDVQTIPVGKGKPNCLCINTGPNGVCNSTAAGDNVQLIPPNQGQPNQTAITAGPNGTLDTAPSGDDAVAGTTITTGPDGVCNTAKSGDDVQVLAVGNGIPNIPALDTGPDGVCNTAKGGDDVQVIASGKGSPNEICVSAGVNTKRDTKPVGDDVIDGENLKDGPDGVCNTAANATNVMSTDVSDAALNTIINNTIYNQAVASFTITRLPAKTVNFDLNCDGMIDVGSWMSAEMAVVRDKCGNAAYDRNIFFVSNPSDGSCGFMDFNQRYGYVHAEVCTKSDRVTAHELGHSVGLAHTPADNDNIMFPTENPWQYLRKSQWDQVNP